MASSKTIVPGTVELRCLNKQVKCSNFNFKALQKCVCIVMILQIVIFFLFHDICQRLKYNMVVKRIGCKTDPLLHQDKNLF